MTRAAIFAVVGIWALYAYLFVGALGARACRLAVCASALTRLMQVSGIKAVVVAPLSRGLGRLIQEWSVTTATNTAKPEKRSDTSRVMDVPP